MLLGTVKLHRSLRRERRLNANSFLCEDQQLLDAMSDWAGERRRIKDVADVMKPNIFRRIYVLDPDRGTPYVSPADMDRTDYPASRLISNAQKDRFDELRLTPGMIVITRSGMNLGWAMIIRADMDGFIGTEDLIRIRPHDTTERGYIGAFLASKLAYFSVRQAISGGSIKHIEPRDVDCLDVPWPPESTRRRIGKAYARAAELRAESTYLIRLATDTIFNTAGIKDLDEGEWFREGRELGFVTRVGSRTLRAWNLSQKAQRVSRRIRDAGAEPLGALVKTSTLRKGPGFKRIPVHEGHGVHLIGQRQLFRFRPRPKHIARRGVPDSAFCEPGTTLIAARGTFGEAETYGRAQYVSGLTSSWLFSNDILRIVPRNDLLSGWLYAFMRSRSAFRLIRATATGSKQQDLHPHALAEIPVPKGSKNAMQRVNELIQKAFELRDAAYHDETIALEGIVSTVREGR